ncbi:DAK2 domain-containing protein, partial [Nostocoides japonicum]|uniref:DAK2 domain-containing protein n=1 Tax=Nostocoides japonicum TaxID=99481 RepID=UPI00065B81E2
PVEATALTVSRAVADAAERAVAGGADLAGTAEAMLRACERALAATTDTLPALTAAGVVDAGAAGYLLLVEGLHRVIFGESAMRPGALLTMEAETRSGTWSGRTSDLPAPSGPHGIGPAEATHGETSGPAYEVMFLLDDTTEEWVRTLTERLDALGDSLLVVGGPELWNVHVHVDDPGAAVEAGIEAGRPHRLRITHLDTQVVERDVVQDVAVVACAAGPGVAGVFRDHGAIVVDSGPGHRASTGELLEAVRSAHARGVVLLPNDADTVLSARAAAQAARAEGLVVHVVPARTVVQGLAALAVLDPGESAEDNAVVMAEAAAATRHGGVTVAAKEGLTSAGHCVPGDILGIVGGDFAVIGEDLETVALDVVEQLLRTGGELVTLVTGEEAPPGLAEAVAATVAERHHRVEVVRVHGGQPHYPLLVGVE